MGKWRDEPMHTGGMMNAGQAPYQKAANDECRICGGTHTILILFFLLSRMDRKFIQSLTFNVILIILIITHISQALVTGKRSYIESCCCCCCVCVCCHCFSSGVKIKRKREREDTWIVEFWSTTLGKNSFCCVSVECETARRSFVRNVDVAPFHHLSSSSLL